MAPPPMAAEGAVPGASAGAQGDDIPGADAVAERPIIETSTVAKVKYPDGTKAINGFRVHEELGAGSFAKVKLCEEESSAEKFAMKVLRKGRLRRQRDFIKDAESGGMKIRTSLDKVYSEIRIQKRLAHQNCIRLFAIFDEAHIDGKLYLVLEFAARGCTMDWDSERCTYYVPETMGLYPEAAAKSLAGDVLCGLGYMHGCLIAHRDIKPQNLLVDADRRLKIGDFGVAIEMDEDFLVQGTEGTYYFYAPETCRTGYSGHDGRKADVWALGVTLWAFLYGSVPFFHQDLVTLLESIGEARLELPEAPAVSEEGRAFLLRTLAAEPEERPLCCELLSDTWCERQEPKATAQMC